MRRTKVFGLCVASLVLLVAAVAGTADAFVGQTTRVSVNSAGDSANMAVFSGVLSADGRYVVFWTSATNMLTGVFTTGTHVYRHDRLTGATEMVSLSRVGNPGNNVSRDPSISANGRFVVFASFASDLVENDTNGVSDVFERDMQTGTTWLVSASQAGAIGDLASGLSGLGGAHEVSDDGRYVAFNSFATNLVPGANGFQQIYVKDLMTGVVVRASVNAANDPGNFTSQSPSLSGNGQVVAFSSAATNLVPPSNTLQVFARDLVSGTTTLESAGAVPFGLTSTVPSISFDGRYVAFVTAAQLDPADVDGVTPDVFLRDRVAGTTVVASLSPNTISGAFSANPSISADGRWVAFSSIDDRMVTPDMNGIVADVFLYDRETRTVAIVSRNDAGDQANLASNGASLTADGQLVLFSSAATNLVGTSTGLPTQLYVRSLAAANVAPGVDAGPDETVDEGTYLKRFGTFVDPDSTSWTGTYDFGTGPLPLVIDPAKKMWFFEHEPLVPGTYTVTLSITDGNATGTDNFQHTVRNVAPQVLQLGPEAFLYFGSTLHRDVLLSDPGQTVPHPTETYRTTVNFGDGTSAVFEGNSFSFDHSYAQAGTYYLTATAADSNGGTSNAVLPVHVYSYTFTWLSGDSFIVGRNLPVKFTVRAPDGTFIFDASVRADVVDEPGNVVAGPYVFGDQPSRSVTASSDAYHVNVDTKDLAPGMYWLRVTFSSPTLVGEFRLGTTGTNSSTRSRALR
jgi:Tol biopolymer transport system component